MSIYYKKYQNKNEDSKAYGKWYARILGHRDLPNVHKACPCFDAIPEYSKL